MATTKIDCSTVLSAGPIARIVTESERYVITYENAIIFVVICVAVSVT